LATIVEYTDQHAPLNEFPARIVSPTRSSACCFSGMDAVGDIQREGQWEYQYKRCRVCGYTVRFVLREVPDEKLIAELRDILAVSFQRNVPDF
jgi:hypothetical protein